MSPTLKKATIDSPVLVRLESLDGTENSNVPKVDDRRTAPLDGGQPETEVGRERLRQRSKMQLKFTEAVGKHMNISVGYDKVAVLVVSWQKELSDMPLEEEIADLKDVFGNLYNFHVEETFLTEHKSDQSLRRAFMNFMHDHDRPNNLCIIYYNGHAEWDTDVNDLFLHPTQWHDNSAPAARWAKAEQMIMDDGEGDFFAILDTCYASNVHIKGSIEKKWNYQLLAASQPDSYTETGDGSFTKAVTRVLRDLHAEGESFTTHALWGRLCTESRLRTNLPMLYDRLHKKDGYIALVPQPAAGDRADRIEAKASNMMLTLDFAFSAKNNALENAVMEDFVKRLVGACKESAVDVRDIRWNGIRQTMEHTAGTLAAVQRFNRRLIQSSEEAKKKRPVDIGEGEPSMRLTKRPTLEGDEMSMLSPCSIAVSDAESPKL